MQYASSLKYGGLQVRAQLCDRHSYLSLGLVCCCCGCPVFWRPGSAIAPKERRLASGKQITVKGYQVVSHFSHFKTGNETQSECEERVGAISKATAAIERTNWLKQRRSLFDSQLASFLAQGYKGDEVNQLRLMAQRFLSQPELLALAGATSFKRLQKQLANWARKHKNQLDNLLIEALNQPELEQIIKAFAPLNYLQGLVERELHGDICGEVVRYLLSFAGSPLLEKLLAIYCYESFYFYLIDFSAYEGLLKGRTVLDSKDEPSLLEEAEWEEVLSKALWLLAGTIATTPWVELFARSDRFGGKRKPEIPPLLESFSILYPESKALTLYCTLLKDSEKKPSRVEVQPAFYSLNDVVSDVLGSLDYTKTGVFNHETEVKIRNSAAKLVLWISLAQTKVPKTPWQKINIFACCNLRLLDPSVLANTRTTDLSNFFMSAKSSKGKPLIVAPNTLGSLVGFFWNNLTPFVSRKRTPAGVMLNDIGDGKPQQALRALINEYPDTPTLYLQRPLSPDDVDESLQLCSSMAVRLIQEVNYAQEQLFD